MAVEDLGSNPMTRLSIGTKIPPPPTPPTLPNAAPKKPMIVPTTILQLNSMSFKYSKRIIIIRRRHIRKRLLFNLNFV